jgi:F-type H+-transporting ATPase subunit gamma
MANRRLLVKRLKAVRNIRKITRTMELIATSRFKKAMDRATEAAEYTRKISEIVGDLGRATSSFLTHLLERRAEEKRSVLLVLTANRGLCGGYNASVLRQALGHIRGLKEKGIEFQLEVSGKRGIKFLNYQKIPIHTQYTTFEDQPTFEAVECVGNPVCGRLHRRSN